ncbi:MAG: hybrid sensor histidine kinase/response regulator [Acidobacteriota bacterium]
MKYDEAFLKRLRATFVAEARERLATLTAGLSLLARSDASENTEIVESMFREAHSLKGAARSVSWSAIESASHSLENVFAALKKREVTSSPELLAAMQQTLDSIGAALDPASSEASEAQLRELARQLEAIAQGSANNVPAGAQQPPAAPKAGKARATLPTVPAPEPAVSAPAPSASVRLSAERLDALLHHGEEISAAKLVTARHLSDLQEISSRLAEWCRESSRLAADVRAAKSMRDTTSSVGRLVDFWEWSHSFLTSLTSRVEQLKRFASADHHLVEVTVNRFQERMRDVALLPFATLLEPFPRMFRELTRERSKEAELVISGGEIEIDRRILEEIKDPLLHLVRNCIDHGIEPPEERQRAGKPRSATVRVAISHRDRQTVEIMVSDDGAGINLAAVRAAAERANLLPAEGSSSLSDSEILPLIFSSGLSTSPIITSISGRGLGLAIVREKVERLGGRVAVETRPGLGTTFRITLPVAMATLRGVLVRANQRLFVVPNNGIERILRVDPSAIATVENRATVLVGGELVGVASLAAALDLPSPAVSREDGKVVLLVLASGGKRLALAVDEIVAEMEILLKSLGPQLQRVRNVAGATMLVSGEVVPVLYVPDLLKSAEKAAGAALQVAHAEAKPSRRKTILVVEDSITSRALLRNILEAAGFEVKVAVDGVDALTILRSEGADLVVSDVEMPRMGGFELTAAIRSDKRLADLPVVLVTARESREDRERGIDVGANAYIQKSSFDQTTLLDTIRRLI